MTFGRRAPARFWTVGAKASHGTVACLMAASVYSRVARCAKRKFSTLSLRSAVENGSFFLTITKIQLKRVNRKLSRRTVDALSTGRFREASSGPGKSLVPHGLVEEKRRQTSRKEENLIYVGRNHVELRDMRHGTSLADRA